MYLSHRSEPFRQRRCATGHVSQSINHSIELGASIELVAERAEVTTKVFAVNGVIGAVDRVLDVAEHGVDPGTLRFLNTGRATAGGNAPVRAGLDDGSEAWQPVGGHFCVRRQMLARPAVDGVAAKALRQVSSVPNFSRKLGKIMPF